MNFRGWNKWAAVLILTILAHPSFAESSRKRVSLKMRTTDTCPGEVNQYPDCDRVSDGVTKSPDYTIFGIPLENQARAGVLATSTGNARDYGTSGSVILFMDNVRIGLVAAGTVGTTTGGGNFFDGLLRVKARLSIDSMEKWWFASGLDVSGRYSSADALPSYFGAQVPLAVGRFIKINDECFVELYAKTGVAVFDNLTQADTALAKWGRPLVGAETIAQCSKVRLLGNYEHLFNWGSLLEGAADRGTVDLSYTRDFEERRYGMKAAGFYLQGQLVRQYSTDTLNAKSGKAGMAGLQLLF